MVICLERGADLHMAQRFYCHSLSLAAVKSRLVLPFWYRLTRVVPDKGPLNVCVCVSPNSNTSIYTNYSINHSMHVAIMEFDNVYSNLNKHIPKIF